MPLNLSFIGCGDNETLRMIKVGAIYMQEAWPIKFVCLNFSHSKLAAAGTQGFAIYNIKKSKWLFFSNQSNEREFTVNGGMIWIQNDFLFVSCFLNEGCHYQFRLYDTSSG